MIFCTKCGKEIGDADEFCGKCGAARSSKPATPAVEVIGAVERDARIRLKREHEKLLTSIGLGSGFATLIGCFLLLALADALGHILGGILVGALSLIGGVLFVGSFRSTFAEKVNRSLSRPNTIDPLSGEPLRMVWWFRWLTAVISIFMLVALSDYVSAPAPPSVSSASVDNVQPMAAEPKESASPEVQEYVTAVQGQIKTLSTSMDRWVALISAPRLNDEDWQLDVAAQLATWKSAYAEAKTRQPPERWADINARYVLALRQLANAADDYAQGIDDSDPDRIREANEEVQSAAETEKVVAAQIFALAASR